MNFKERLGKELLFFDGAMGTILQESGLKAGELPELWNITHEDIIFNIHKSYLDAGCDIIKTNTFGANRLKFTDTGYTSGQIVSKGVEIAKKAIARANKTGRRTYVALDIGSCGKLLAPFGDLPFESAYDIFSEMVVHGAKAGADLILIETMSDLYEVKAAMLAAKEHSGLPVILTLTFDASGKLLTGGDIPAAVCLAESLGADAVGFNCGLGPGQMKELLPVLTKHSSIPIVINPNAGLPVTVDEKTVFNVNPDEFASNMAGLVEGGAAVIGGCCGTTPAHIAAAVKKCRGMDVIPVADKNLTVVSSYTKAVVFGDKTVIVGERINPTGKPRLKQALRENDMEHLCREGLSQIEAGADILDVNVGLPEIDEAAILQQAVFNLQGITGTPLQIDTSDIAAMERAMRVYNGKPLVNSVNGKKESLEAVLPLVKKYGAAVVALTLDEEGIPETAQGRIKIAERIIQTAQTYGIQKKDIIIDALALTISTGPDNAEVTLQTLDYIKNTMGVNTILGVSNISFGLPARECINSTFFTLAMSKGLSAAIINPLNKPMTDAFYSYQVISGNDGGLDKYIEMFADAKSAAEKPMQKELSLFDAIVKGLKEQSAILASELIKTTQPLDIINNQLVPALDEVGKGFEQNKVFLPQLLMSAEAAKSAFEAIRSQLLKQGVSEKKRGKIILATVKGDIHDIGKNILKALLENYNFDIIDLGKDVSPETIVQTALREKVKLVGLSALMTTTVVNMEKTIKLLHKQAPDCKIMVGGAVLTGEYSDKIGADFYSKDALGGIRYANEIFV